MNKLNYILLIMLQGSTLYSETTSELLSRAYDVGDSKRAIVYVNRALEIDPGCVHAYTFRAEIYRNWNEYELALIDINKALSLAPNYIDAYRTRSDIYRAMGDIESADKDIATAGELRREGKSYDLELLDKAIEADPANPLLYRNRAYAYLTNRDMKNEAMAVKDFKMFFKLGGNANNYIIFRDMAAAQENIGDFKGAAATYDEALKLFPDDTLYQRRALVQERLGDIDKVRSNLSVQQTLVTTYPRRF